MNVAPAATRSDHLEAPVMHRSRLVLVAWGLCLLGAAAFAGSFFLDGGAPRAWSALLAGLTLPLWLAVGSLFFLAAHSLGGARWVVPYQRVMEGVGAGLPLALVAFVALAWLGLPYVYEWSHANPGRDSLFRDPHGGKAWWMDDSRWFITGAAILGLWLVLQRGLQARSAAGDGRRRDGHVRWSVATLLILIPTFTLFCWDTLLSLEVGFTSAVFGVYCLVAAIHAFLGATVLLVAWLGSRGLSTVVRPHLDRDLGTWLVAWSCIVTYLAFAQYLIIAFANIDEETAFFLRRSQHGYGQQYLLDIVLRCGLPFALLLSQSLRQRRWALAVAGAGVLLGTWLELHWLVVPAFSPNLYRGPLGPEALVALGFLAGAFLLAVRGWRRAGLVGLNDSRLLPAINAEHLS